MHKIQEVEEYVSAKVYTPNYSRVISQSPSEEQIELYTLEVMKNRLVVNYIVNAVIHNTLEDNEVSELMVLASTRVGLMKVYTGLVTKLVSVKLFADECARYTNIELN